MKKTFLALTVLLCISISAQKKYRDIMNSTNVSEIENFLKEAHPDDTRRMILKRKLPSLKNSSWMKSGKNSSTVRFAANNANSNLSQKNTTPSKSSLGDTNIFESEEQEFSKLFTETTKTHKDKTVRLLNQLFDNDITNEKAILLIKNDGDCNIIVRIKGKEDYNLAVPARGENFITLNKGEYQLSGNMCEARYFSTKSIDTNMLVTLYKPSTSILSGQKLSFNSKENTPK